MNNKKVFPDYENSCFSNLPQFVEVFFNLESRKKLRLKINKKDVFNKKNLIFLFIDSFGWRFIDQFQRHPFLKKIQKYGEIIKATSQFPSTTAAHVTTINTGLPVGKHGIFEWFYFEPKIDEIIAPLLFSVAGPKENRGGLESLGINPENIFPFQTIYERLKKAGVKSYTFGFKEFTPSPYSNTMFKGVEKIFPYSTLSEAITNIFNILENNRERTYIYLYFEKIDSINHLYGPSSHQSKNEILTFLEIMEKIFWKNFKKYIENTAFVIFADHGHMEINPEKTVYLNQVIPNIEKYFKKNKKGKILAPAGSPRDMFLYIKDNLLEEAEALLKNKLSGRAEVLRVNHLIKKGYFGEKVSKLFLERVGNLLLLPYSKESIWWYKKDYFEVRYFGHHGGLSEEEMQIGIGIV